MSFDGRSLALMSLRGLAVGDAFGSCFDDPINYGALGERRVLPGPWLWTDDTQMACSIFAVLSEHGRIGQDALAQSFAEHYDIYRRYGPGTSRILRLIRQKGYHWRELAQQARDGRGSWGNGAAMRVAPLGAWFADDIDRVVIEARASAEVTHAHPDAVAGAVAVAIAAALSAAKPQLHGAELLDTVAAHMPDGPVRDRLRHAESIDDSGTAAEELGVGHDTSALDTVPFGLWVVAHHGHDFADACWTAVAAGGDIDTTCAIIGGILGARATSDGIPLDWLERCEPLPEWAITLTR
ncbi:ADP-ribosylglycohydrolase family protein [Nocardia tengchongensis]|uniref:ADP-ribosylglycohydrolase family protein n=1 Tax=Nocardia tengchongensis TaxID=2055889 RepID=A0ABX8CQ16_9NOCA|nr:ADP-ribosylglycohydrolase family protein [Nocardia tengchongensis]QVI22010.1 ADP-ribosylglycohydrolase family protein [Nocardia tengchongensis]